MVARKGDVWENNLGAACWASVMHAQQTSSANQIGTLRVQRTAYSMLCTPTKPTPCIALGCLARHASTVANPLKYWYTSRIKYSSIHASGLSVLLALDTATSSASLAAYDLTRDALLAEWTWQARRRQTQDLLGAAQTLLRQVGVAPAELTALAATTGPGSFTGVRVGISTVKGIGLGLAKMPSVVGVPTLCVTAAPFLTLLPAGTRLCATMQAGRGRFNWTFFGADDLLRRPAAAEHANGSLAELVACIEETESPLWLVGEQTPALVKAVQGLAHLRAVDDVSGLRRAGSLARLAALHLAAGTDDGLDGLSPLYLSEPG